VIGIGFLKMQPMTVSDAALFASTDDNVKSNCLLLSWLLNLATFYLFVCPEGSLDLILPLAAWCNNLEPLHCQFVIRDSASDDVFSCLLNGYVIRSLCYESFVISSASGLSLVYLLCILDLVTILLLYLDGSQ
jgi:hypothetical protein